MNGCDYLGHIVAGKTGTVDIVCPAGKEITAKATTKCTIDVGPQTGLGTLTMKNIGAGTTREVEVVSELKGVKYSHTAGEGIGKCASGSATNGTSTGISKVTAEEDGGAAHVGIFLE